MAKKSNGNAKKRNWAFILYPESAPEDWREQLQMSGLRCAISPFHDKDINPDGTTKKPHYHIILCYSGPTSYNVVKAFTNGKLGQTIPDALEQIQGYYRYFTHMDNPEKYQYDAKDIQGVNGFDIRDFVDLTKSEVKKIKGEVSDYIFENEITEYADLVLVCRADDAPPDWFDVVSSNTMYFDKTIQSLRYKLKGRRD